MPTLLKRMIGGEGDPFYLKFWVNLPPLERNRRFEPIFARTASAIKPSESSSIKRNTKSTTSFPMSLRWTRVRCP